MYEFTCITILLFGVNGQIVSWRLLEGKVYLWFRLKWLLLCYHILFFCVITFKKYFQMIITIICMCSWPCVCTLCVCVCVLLYSTNPQCSINAFEWGHLFVLLLFCFFKFPPPSILFHCDKVPLFTLIATPNDGWNRQTGGKYESSSVQGGRRHF